MMSVELPADHALRNYLAPGMRVEVSDPDWPEVGTITQISAYGAVVRTDYEQESGLKLDSLGSMDVWHDMLTLGYLALTMQQTIDVLGIPREEALAIKDSVIDELAPFGPTPTLKRFESVLHAALVTGIFSVSSPNPDFDLKVQTDDLYDRDRLLTAGALFAVTGGSPFSMVLRYNRTAPEMGRIASFYLRVRKENNIPSRFGVVLFGHATGRIPKLADKRELKKLIPETILIDLPE